MMKVSLLTLHSVKNYGSVLQTFATQEYLREKNIDVEIVDYIRPDTSDTNILEAWTTNDSGVVKQLKKIVLLPTLKRWDKVFNGFLKAKIKLSKEKYMKNNDFFEKGIPEADIYCVGSDQVWNSKWNRGIDTTYFLDYVPNNKKKISFASSFGKSHLDNFEKEITFEYLKKFDALSVRENSAVEIIKDLGLREAIQILDPTLLFKKEQWEEFSTDKLIAEDYLLIYQLNSNKEFDRYAKDYARKNNLKVVRICTRYDQFIKVGKSVIIPEIEEFVSLFINAKCVLTDSFHATAFSINLNVPFISIYPAEFSTRISSILELMHLTDRHLKKYNLDQINISNINFDYANNVLNEYRNRTDSFIEKNFRVGE